MRTFALRLFSPDAAGGGGSGAGDPPPAGDTAAKELETLRAKLAELEGRETAAAKAKADAEAAEAVKRGEAERLYTDEKAKREAAEARLAELDAREQKRLKAIDERNKSRVGEIPEGRRSLVPKALKGEDLADYLDANWALLTEGVERPAGTKRAPGVGGGDDEHKGIPDVIKQEAANRRVDPAAWWKLVQRHDPKRAKALTTGAN